MRDYPSSYDFEWAQRRVVYAIQVFTASIARSLPYSMLYLRCKEKHNPLRKKVADIVKQLRANSEINVSIIRDKVEERLADPKGYAECLT